MKTPSLSTRAHFRQRTELYMAAPPQGTSCHGKAHRPPPLFRGRLLPALLPAFLLALATVWLLLSPAPVQADARQAPAPGPAALQLHMDSSSLSAADVFTATNPLTTARSSHTATLLPNGKVLVAGGNGAGGRLASAELYDPATGTWSATGALATSAKLSHGHAAAQRQGAGRRGIVTPALSPAPSCTTRPPARGAPPARLARRVSSHTATLLPNGKVLVAGGYGAGTLDSAELYDPATGAWSATGSLNTARERHTATLLPNGKVLVAGGYGDGTLDSAELYDPATGTWSATGSLNTRARGSHGHAAAQRQGAGRRGYGADALDSAELYDPATGAWSATGSLNTARAVHTATLLPNGKVLVAGGYGAGALASAELYDPATGTWSATGSLNTARVPSHGHAAAQRHGAGRRGVRWQRQLSPVPSCMTRPPAPGAIRAP